MELFGDEVERISRVDAVTGELLGELDEVVVFPATHYVAGDERMRRAIRHRGGAPRAPALLRGAGKLLEAQRLHMRTEHDLEMIAEVGTAPASKTTAAISTAARPATAQHPAQLLPRGLPPS